MARTKNNKLKPTQKKSARSNLNSKNRVTTLKRPRRLKLPKYKLFRFGHRIKHPVHLPSAWQLTKQTSSILWRYRWLFLGLAVIYGILNILLVKGLSNGTDVNSLKHQFSQALKGNLGQLTVGLSVFVTLLASSGNNTSATAGVYQLILGLIISLAVIWALRHVLAGEKIGLRDPFYKGIYPLIPFILVLLVILLQTVPFLIGGTLYNLVISNGIAVGWLEKSLWALLFLVLTVISIYMLCSSIFGLYIVTLPDMTPLKALRSARQLVRYRRPQVFRKLIFLPIMLLIVSALIMLPIILWAAILAPWVFFGLTMVALVVIHAYLYTFYRELIK